MRYTAFLRAINTTGRFVRMERLRQAFIRMGFTNVETHIQSGNVLFDSSGDPVALERQIEGGLQGLLGFPVPTFIRTGAELLDLARHDPFPGRTPEGEHTLYVVFLHQAPSADVSQELRTCADEINWLEIFNHHLFWLYHRNRGESSFSNAKIEKILRAPATLRNITTVRKIADKYRS